MKGLRDRSLAGDAPHGFCFFVVKHPGLKMAASPLGFWLSPD